MRRATRRAVYLAVLIGIGAAWWFGKASFFKDAVNYVTAAMMPQNSRPSPAASAVPAASATRPAAPLPSAPGSNPWVTDPRAVALLSAGQEAIKAQDCDLAAAKLRAIADVWGHGLFDNSAKDNPDQAKVRAGVGALFQRTDMCRAFKRFQPPPPPPNREPAETANPPFAAAQRYEAQGDFRHASLAYNAAADFGSGYIPGPYYEDSLLGFLRMCIKDTTPYGHPAACATIKRLKRAFPNPRPDLLAATNQAIQDAHCDP